MIGRHVPTIADGLDQGLSSRKRFPLARYSTADVRVPLSRWQAIRPLLHAGEFPLLRLNGPGASRPHVAAHRLWTDAREPPHVISDATQISRIHEKLLGQLRGNVGRVPSQGIEGKGHAHAHG